MGPEGLGDLLKVTQPVLRGAALEPKPTYSKALSRASAIFPLLTSTCNCCPHCLLTVQPTTLQDTGCLLKLFVD